MSPIEGLTDNKDNCIMVDFCDLVSGVKIMSRFRILKILVILALKKLNLEVDVKLLWKKTVMLFASLSSGKNKIYIYVHKSCICLMYCFI